MNGTPYIKPHLGHHKEPNEYIPGSTQYQRFQRTLQFKLDAKKKLLTPKNKEKTVSKLQRNESC